MGKALEISSVFGSTAQAVKKRERNDTGRANLWLNYTELTGILSSMDRSPDSDSRFISSPIREIQTPNGPFSLNRSLLIILLIISQSPALFSREQATLPRTFYEYSMQQCWLSGERKPNVQAAG
jgi:hypothetical protein